MSRYRVALLAALLAPLPPTLAAQEHYTFVPISRIILVDIKPGKGSEFWTELRRTLRPLYDEWKKQGLISKTSPVSLAAGAKHRACPHP